MIEGISIIRGSRLLLVMAAISCRIFAQLPERAASQRPDDRFKADFLLVVAHPDDETAIGSYLAKLVFDDQKRIDVAYCNRGTGGGNSAGMEQSAALGLEREIEARRGLESIGVHNVWFLDGIDTPSQDVLQSLARWKHGTVLEELVRIVRLTRPDVIAAWLPHYVAGENHGDHQASGVIATEAFDMAGDPAVFPAQTAMPREHADIQQLNEGLVPWQAKKIYYFSDASHGIEAPGVPFDLRQISRARGVPFYRLAAAIDTFHRTQGDVSADARHAIENDDYTNFIRSIERFHLIFGKSNVPCAPSGDLFEGVGTAAIAFAPPRNVRAEPPPGRSLTLGGAFAFYREFWSAHGLGNLAPLVQPEMEVGVGSYVHIPLIIRNETADSCRVTLTPELPGGWKRGAGAGHYPLSPHEVFAAQTFVFAPKDPDADFRNIVWKADVNGKLIGSVTIRVRVLEWALPE